MHDYRRLRVWQRAQALTVAIYEITRAFPKSEMFGLTNQMRRSAVSVVANLAEGAGRGSPGDFRRFIRIANGSVCELEALVLVAISVPELSPFVPSDLSDELAQIKRMLYRLEGSFEAPANR